MARTKGAVNKPKRLLYARLADQFPDYDPIIEMVKVANDKDADPIMRFNANKEVAQYLNPKLKAMDITQETSINGNIKVNIGFVSK